MSFCNKKKNFDPKFGLLFDKPREEALSNTICFWAKYVDKINICFCFFLPDGENGTVEEMAESSRLIIIIVVVADACFGGDAKSTEWRHDEARENTLLLLGSEEHSDKLQKLSLRLVGQKSQQWIKPEIEIDWTKSQL